MYKQLIAPATLAAMLAAAPLSLMANETSGGSGGSQTGQAMPANEVSSEEALATETFGELDQNQDGALDEDELNAWGNTAAGGDEKGKSQEKRAERMLEKYDNDDDGTISQEEMEEGPHGAGGPRGSNM